ncbi:MAG TPA: sugar porter family MFS transporter [Cyclobacteriaceae bacterium]|nr:sugar porter family MFS transporter [Cyclobacteriaceae bacterium]
MKYNNYVLLISLTAALGGLLFGFDIAIFSGTIPFIRSHFHLSDAGLGWTGSSLYLGCIIGSLLTGFITDRFGRKIPMIGAALIFTVSYIMMGWSRGYDALIVWRIIAGIGVGSASNLSPLYIAEISPAGSRGKLVSINQLAIVIGILMAYISNYFLAGIENNWRWMFASGAVPSLIFLLGVLMLPESPRWLAGRGRLRDALSVLKKISGEKEAANEIEKIETSLKTEIRGRFSDLVQPGIRAIVVIGIALAVFQQISGANAVFFYAPIIFGKAGMNVKDQLFQQILIGLINLTFTFVAMSLVDRLGRRLLMLAGSLLMAIFLLCIGIFFYFQVFGGIFLPVIVLAFIATYATTLAPVTWVLISEIFPTRIRGIAISAATTMLWTACFGLAYGFPVLIGLLDAPKTFFLFALICAVYFFVLLKFVSETKGKTLEEINSPNV